MIRLVLEGPDALRAARLLEIDDARIAAEVKPKRRGPLTNEELEARILAVLPANDSADAYERADLPRPWYRAGRALSRLRARGLVEIDRGGYRKAVSK